jgi:tetratricopeptide (TPR) repeat protein
MPDNRDNSPPKPPAGNLPEGLASAFGFDDDRWMHMLRSAVSDTHKSSTTQRKLGHYTVLEIAGRGGQGAVYKVVQPGTGRTIALKRLNLGCFAESRDRLRFQREMEATAALNHPGIVTLLGHDTIDDQPVLLMEWIQGQEVDLWSRRKDTTRDAVLRMFAEIADAIAHAHRKGVLHRDLKPSNVLIIRRDDATFAPKVLDFGLSRMLGISRNMTATEGFMGTPAYASPEQASARWQDVDTRSDIFSLGVMLYEALTATQPFTAQDMPTLLSEIVHREPLRPSRIASAPFTLDAEIDAIIFKALSKQPSQRYESMDAFAADLRRKLAGQAVLAHPPKLLYQSRAFARQHKFAVTAGLIALTAVATLAIVSSILAARLQARSAQLQTAIIAQEQATSLAQRSAQLAQDREALAQASAQTLLGLLRGMSDEAATGLTVSPELLAIAENRLRQGDFAADPKLALGMWNVLAQFAFVSSNIVRMQGFIDEGERYRVGVDVMDSEQSTWLVLKGLLIEAQGNYTHAADYYQQAWCIAEATDGPFAPTTLRAMGNYALALSNSNQHEAALALHHDLLLRNQHVYGPTSLKTANSWCNIAITLRRMRRHDESRAALRMAQHIDSIAEDGGLANSPRITREVSRRALADGDLITAEIALMQLVDYARVPRGDGSATSSSQLLRLADFYQSHDRHADALPLLREACDLTKSQPGTQARVNALCSLAYTLQNLDDTAAATTLFDEAQQQAQSATIEREVLLRIVERYRKLANLPAPTDD